MLLKRCLRVKYKKGPGQHGLPFWAESSAGVFKGASELHTPLIWGLDALYPAAAENGSPGLRGAHPGRAEQSAPRYSQDTSDRRWARGSGMLLDG